MQIASPVWPLLRSFSWQELRHHGLRHATAVLAVLLGVALAFSVHLINESALSEFSAAVRSVNGQADLSLKASRGLLDEALYARIATHPQVAVASPVIDVQTQAWPQDPSSRPQALRVLGLDAMVAAALTPGLLPQLDPALARDDRTLLFAPDTISLNATARRLLQAHIGSTIEIQTGLKRVKLRVIGTVAEGGEPLGVTDIAGAQDALGLVGQLSRLDVKLAAGASLGDVRREWQLPSGVLADSAQDSTQRVSNVSRAYRVNLTVLALVALFTGAFLVFSILSLSVSKRQQQFALLGVLGLSARERLLLVLWESAFVGLIGSVLGIALGSALAAAALRLLAGDLGGGYFPGIAPHLQWSVWAALVYGALGVAAAMLGGLLPARAAQHMAPAQALKGLGESSQGVPAWWPGPALMLLAGALAQLPPWQGLPLGAYLSVASLLVGGIVCVPVVVGALLRPWPQHWLRRQAALMLAVSRARHMRHSATVLMAGVVASLSLSVALTVMVASFRGSVTRWLDVVLPADLYARTARAAGQSQDDGLPKLDTALLADIARTPGVTRIVGAHVGALSMRPDQAAVALIARPLAQVSSQTLPLVGELKPARSGLINVYVSEAMVDLYEARPGTTLALPLRVGDAPALAYVRGVWRDYARQQGAILMDRDDYQRLTGDSSVNELALWLSPDVRTAEVQQGIRARVQAAGLSGALMAFAEPRELRQTTLRIFDRSFAVTYWLQAVAIGIGLFGTAASFSAQVLARRKEFGLLSHLGFTRGQLLTVVASEGAVLGCVGALMGLALGILVSLVLVHVVNPQSFHWTMDMLLPWPRLLALCASVVLAATVTAWLAGRAAASADAVMAVKEDW